MGNQNTRSYFDLLIKTGVFILVVSFIFLPDSHSYGRNKDKTFSLVSRHTTYSDITTSSTATGGEEFEPTLDAEVGLRFKSLFQLITVFAQSSDGLLKFTGVGVRIDTPGIFWFGRSRSQYRSKAKNYPVNTSLFSYFFKADIENDLGVVETSTGSSLGLAMDIHLFNKFVYINVQGAIAHLQGNAFSSVGAGLGVDF